MIQNRIYQVVLFIFLNYVFLIIFLLFIIIIMLNTVDDQKEQSTLESSNINDIEETFEEIVTHRKRKKSNLQDRMKQNKVDSEHYVPYQPKDQHTEKG